MSVTKNVKIVNNSLSDTNVKWICPSSDLKFTISPETLTVGMYPLLDIQHFILFLLCYRESIVIQE